MLKCGRQQRTIGVKRPFMLNEARSPAMRLLNPARPLGGPELADQILATGQRFRRKAVDKRKRQHKRRNEASGDADRRPGLPGPHL